MQYLCLAYYDPEKMDAMAPADMQALVDALPAKDAALQQTGALVWNGSLQGPKATFGMRPRGGKPVVTDGPYAEAKEMVGGFLSSKRRTRRKPYALPRCILLPRWVSTSAGGSRCTRLGPVRWRNSSGFRFFVRHTLA